MRSLRMKMVMIMVILILALMLTTGAFLMSGVGNFYVSPFMAERMFCVMATLVFWLELSSTEPFWSRM